MSNLQSREQAVINAPVGKIWAVITDINLLHRINPGVVQAIGRMDRLGETRTCNIRSRGRSGTMTERLIELTPKRKTVWTIESDTMGMKKMLNDTRFVFNLEKVTDNQTMLIAETYYRPAHLMAKVLNALILRKTIGKAQKQILANIKSLTEQ